MNGLVTFEVKIELERNLVRTRWVGRVTAADMKEAAGLVERTLPGGLRTGFFVLADLSGLVSMELECAPHLSRIMDICLAHGVGRVVRVIPDHTKDIGINILSIIHYRGKVQTLTCDTMEEAELALS